MANSYFRFKQFTIHQDRSAMKVCTDSCILGAWTAHRIQGAQQILDIGTGTGLLSLMLAQKTGAVIDSIESDPDSAAQARENIRDSPWSQQIHLLEADARSFIFEKKYDFIITNPPFFESDLLSQEEKKNNAKHGLSLTLEELLRVILSCLHPEGLFSILLPYHRTDFFERLALSRGLFPEERWTIRQTPGHNPFRSISLFSFKKPGNRVQKEMDIRDKSGKYSVHFTDLMNDYYG